LINNKTLNITKAQFGKFKAFLKSQGYSFEERPHQYFLARKPGLVVNLYNSGSIVLAGKDEQQKQAVRDFLDTIGAKLHIKNEKQYLPIHVTGTRIGTDEAGKGDYFGPLVVAGVVADESQIEKFVEIGIKDSKNLSDTTIGNLAIEIKKIVGKKNYSVIVLKPKKYNQLYEKQKNVNKILGWAHARVIENLLQQNSDCETAVSDQFGDESYIENALMKLGKKVELIQTPKAERELTVAAASILARSEFVQQMQKMSLKYDLLFPKGAVTVIAAAEEFVKSHGRRALADVAKIHFKTTKKIKDLSENH